MQHDALLTNDTDALYGEQSLFDVSLPTGASVCLYTFAVFVRLRAPDVVYSSAYVFCGVALATTPPSKAPILHKKSHVVLLSKAEQFFEIAQQKRIHP